MAIKETWQRELKIFSENKTTFILEKNIYDVYHNFVKEDGSFSQLDELLNDYLTSKGYEVIFYDPINGFYNRFLLNEIDTVIKKYGLTQNKFETNNYLGKHYKCNPVEASEYIKKMMLSDTLIAIVMFNASRMIAKPDVLDEEERILYLNLQYASMNSRMVYKENSGLRKNLLYLVADKINDIPAWFYLDNPFEKLITIPYPNFDTRKEYIKYRENEFKGFNALDEKEKEKFRNELSNQTVQMTCTEINGLKNIALSENYSIDEIDKAINLYKFGISENPWLKLSPERIDNAAEIIKKRVKGQDYAVSKTVDVVKRSALGMSGLQHSSHSKKPRGVLFFSGPTGTGKTELAKALAELIFGNEGNLIRFDMSEYKEPNSDQKLLGAPPGYVGYDAGGQLTNAVREKPFSIILFDEIEKAHPTILDKFLQVLEDGRMTDGQGNTVYFSETLIVFTSNIGTYVDDGKGGKAANITYGDNYNDVRKKIKAAVYDYFTVQLGRPEIFGRIGANNIVVFNYITNEVVGEILDKQLDNIINYAAKIWGISLDFSGCRKKLLEEALKNAESGGRGIGNVVEDCAINPLARYVFDSGLGVNGKGKLLRVNDFYIDEYDNVVGKYEVQDYEIQHLCNGR